jgi:large subunit ribosomal protein L9
MKVILLVDIPKLGRKNDIKEVADGYARNFLIPKKMAIIATPEKIKEIERLKQQEEMKKRQELALYEQWARRMKNIKLEFPIKADEKGKLFGSLHKEEIIAELKKFEIELSEKQIILDKPLKEVGEYLIKIKFSPEIETELKVLVKPL